MTKSTLGKLITISVACPLCLVAYISTSYSFEGNKKYNIDVLLRNFMATADQIKSLIRTHYSNQREQFSTIALQVAAHEAMQGHQSVALEIRGMVDGAKIKDYDRILPFTPELEHLIRLGKNDVRMSQLVVSDILKASIII